MATVQEERTALASVYPGRAWSEKVRRMPDSQVTAIYLRFKQQGKIK